MLTTNFWYIVKTKVNLCCYIYFYMLKWIYNYLNAQLLFYHLQILLIVIFFLFVYFINLVLFFLISITLLKLPLVMNWLLFLCTPETCVTCLFITFSQFSIFHRWVIVHQQYLTIWNYIFLTFMIRDHKSGRILPGISRKIVKIQPLQMKFNALMGILQYPFIFLLKH